MTTEERKVMGELVEKWRERCKVYSRKSQETAYMAEGIQECIGELEGLLAKPTESGRAEWYPSREEVLHIVDADAYVDHAARTCALIRTAINLHREQIGRADGEVVAWQYKAPKWRGWCFGDDRHMSMSDAIESGYETRELVVRQPFAESGPARVVGEPVAWRYLGATNWVDGPPHPEDVAAQGMRHARLIELAYSAPATVPAGLIEALMHQRQVDEDGTECGVNRQAVDQAIGILRSLAPSSPKDPA